jgi:cell division protein FtsQ
MVLKNQLYRNVEVSSFNSQLPTPNSQLSTLNSQLSTPNSQLPTPNSQLPTPNSQLVTSASKTQLKRQHRRLQQQRRIKVVKSLWRFACMSMICGGLGWAINQTDWKISSSSQIRVQGNQYLSDNTIRSMLEISYPKLIMELAPEELTAKLMTKGSIASAKIDRQLLPPQLIVQIQDLPPIAGVIQDEQIEARTFVDERGRQLPMNSYHSTIWASLPKLRLRLPTGGICPGWTQLYQTIQTSPVAVGIIDCRNPHDLFLQTEIGQVRLGDGGDKSRLISQIQQLDRLRDWQKGTDPVNVDYLDLENPDAPKLQFKPAPTSITPTRSFGNN